MSDMDQRNQQAQVSSKGSNWFRIGSKVFLGLALVPPALMFLSTLGDAEWLLVVADHFPLLAGLAIGLSTVSGLLHAAHKFGFTKRSSCEDPPEQGGR